MDADTKGTTVPSDHLKGWKEIARFLHTSERTAQRWGRELRLPVRRIGSSSRIVVASCTELEAWLESTEGRTATLDRPQDPQPNGLLAEAADIAAAEALPATPIVGSQPAAGVSEETTPTVGLLTRRVAFVSFGLLLPVGALAFGAFYYLRSVPTGTTPAKAPPLQTKAATPTIPTDLGTGDILMLRLTTTRGTSANFGVEVGTAATWQSKGHPALEFSVLRTPSVFLYVNAVESQSPEGVRRLTGLVASPIEPGKKISIPHLGGLAEIEWVRTIRAAHPSPAAR